MMSVLPKRPLWRRLTIAAVVFGFALLAWGCWAYYVANSFSGRIAAIRAAGDPASIADLAPQAIPPNQDAAAQLAEVAPQIEAFARKHGRFFNTPLGKAYETRQRGKPPTSEQVAAIRAILDRFPEVDAAIARAAACDDYASRLDYSLTHPQFLAAITGSPMGNRTVARFVQWQVEVAIVEGRHIEALQKGIQLLRLGRLFGREPGFVGGMIAVAIQTTAVQSIHDALAAGPVPMELHDELDRELAQQDDMQPFVWSMKSERAIDIAGLQQNFGGMAGVFVNTVGRPLGMHHTAILDLFDAVLPEADEPWHVNAGDVSMIFKKPTGLGTMADLLQPSLESAYEAANRSLATTRALRIYNALRKFVAEHGREANSLAELSLPKEATIDPFSGKPLQMKRIEGGWVVYSVAKDGQDDGGDLDGGEDYGVGPAKAWD